MEQTINVKQAFYNYDIFFPIALDSQVNGFTNAPTAVYKGDISADVLQNISQQLMLPSTIELFETGQVIALDRHIIQESLERLVGVLRVDTEKEVVDIVAMKGFSPDSIAKETGEHYDKHNLRHYQFSLEGDLKSSEEVKGLNPYEHTIAWMPNLISGLRGRIESVRNRKTIVRELNSLFHNLRGHNTEDALELVDSIPVYRGSIPEVEEQTQKSIMAVPSDQKLKYSLSKMIGSYFSGANAIVLGNHQYDNPLQGIPVILK